MRHLALGVIGHVNHGKTSLVRALTGMQTDRLEEEQRRGMSIVLGFAYLATSQGTLDLIDVPGHEQFVRTMVAGATGIGATLLVVNGREGAMPQTIEHVAIADLLGLLRGVVAISRADELAPAERPEVQRRLRASLRGTHLEFAPVVFTSSVTGEGVAALTQKLEALLASEAPRRSGGAHFWLPVDRVFTLPGHGAIVTGTLRGAPLRVGETLACFPGGATGAVRQLQVHGEPVEEAVPGQRVGVNLRHLGIAEVARGDVLAPPGSLQPGTLLDVAVSLVTPAAEDALDGRSVRLLFGTTEVGASVRVLARTNANRPILLAQLRTARPVVAVAGEPCILRAESPAVTLGGGRVLDAAPRRHARSDAAALQRLRVLAGGSERQRLLERLKAAGAAGVELATLAAESRLDSVQLAPALREFALVEAGRAWHLPLVVTLEQRIAEALRTWHAAHPLRPMAPLSVCRAALPASAGETLLRLLLDRLHAAGTLRRRDGQVALASHDPLQALDETGRSRLAALEAGLRAGGMNPPDAPLTDASGRALIELLAARGDVLLLPGQPPAQRIAFHRSAVDEATGRLRAAFPTAAFTVSQARALLASTRKFTVPLLEHLHATGQTRRRGDAHVFVAERVSGGG